MMKPIVQWLLHNRALMLITAFFIGVVGWYSWNGQPIDAYPDVTNVQVTILTTVHGLSAPDVELQITFPIEQKMSGMRGVTQVRSLSKAGLSSVIVVFEDGTDDYFARQLVFERLQEAKDALPPGVEPEMAPLSTGLGEIFQYTLDGEKFSPTDLRTIQDWVVAPQLRPIAGVSEVNSFGGFAKQYQVLVDPERLQKYGLTLAEVLSTLERNNANAGGKFIEQGWEQTYIRSLGLFRSMADIEQVVLKARGGVPVLVRDIAEIVIGHEIRQGAVTRDNRGEVVAGMVIMLKGANSKTVVSKVKETIPRIQASLPEGVKLNVFYDRTYLIQACIQTVIDALSHGAGWVILVLFLFLAELRTACLVILSLPLTFAMSFILMRHFEITSNLMSLGGLAFSVGMVVDATIVVLENMRRHFAHRPPGKTNAQIAADAVAEVGQPVAFSVFIIILVLVPLFSLQGMEAKMFGPLALTMLISIASSLILALTVMPVLGLIALPRGEESEFMITRFMRWFYRVTLDLALRFPLVTVLGAVALVVWAGVLIPRIGTDFMPSLQEGAIAINAVRLPNASLEGAVKTSAEIERRLQSIPEIDAVICKTGRAEISEDPMGPEQTDIFITLKDKTVMPGARSQGDLVEPIRKELNEIPGLRYSFSQPIALRVNELISGIKSDVAVKVFGDDLDVLAEVARKVVDISAGVPGAVDVKATQISGMDQIDIEIDRAQAAKYGLNAEHLNEIIEAGVGGKVVSTFIEGQRRFGLAVRFKEPFRKDLAAITALNIPTPDGALIPLSQIAKVHRVESPIEIARESGRRRMVVEANVRGRDLGGFVADLQQRLATVTAQLPTGYSITYGGQFENQQRAMARLSFIVPLVLVLILVLLMMAFGNLRDAAVVILNVPFAMVGGIITVYMVGISLSVSAAVAFIVLLGIAVQNGVILIAFFRQLIDRGVSLNRAIRVGSALRFRPLLMTALTSFIGHIPMLYSTGVGSEIQKPLAWVVNGGLITSTFLTLYILPIIFRWVERQRVVWAWVSRRRKQGEDID